MVVLTKKNVVQEHNIFFEVFTFPESSICFIDICLSLCDDILEGLWTPGTLQVQHNCNAG